MNFRPFDPMIFFDADTGGAGAGTGDQATEMTAAGAGNTPTGGDKPGEGAPRQDEIRLTPAQLAERLERARSAMLKDVGFDSKDALLKVIQDGKAALDAQKTDAERQAEALKQAQERLQALEVQANQAQTQADQAALHVEALGMMAGKFASPKAALKLVNLDGIKRAEDGSYPGLQAAIDKLATDEPWTLAQPGKKSIAPQIGATNPEGDGKKVTSEAERRARYFGNFGSGQGFFAGGGSQVSSKTGAGS